MRWTVDQPIDPMDEIITIGKNELQRQRLDSSWGGQAASLEAASRDATGRAGILYGQREDTKAAMWREFAEWLKERGMDARREQAKYRK